MNLILISGAEATCKTDLSKRLVQALGYKYQSKDHIKEAMFDKHERSTWNYSWYESRAKAEFFEEIQGFISTKTDVIIESNFSGQDREKLKSLISEGVILKEIHCYARGMTGFKRAVHRNETGSRHSGHHDRRWYPKVFIQSLLHSVGINIGAHKPVKLGDEILNLDTTIYPGINFNKVIEFVR